jgi:ATP adenylyltransferase
MGFERLWAPWRLAYIEDAGSRPSGSGGCFLCEAAAGPPELDAERLVVGRGEGVVTVLNRHPYNSGHLMISPADHVGSFTELADELHLATVRTAKRAIRLLDEVMRPHAYNLGWNLGDVAGGSHSAHLHLHVVPRWGGDTNFMPVIGDVKVMPQLLTETRHRLADAWEASA